MSARVMDPADAAALRELAAIRAQLEASARRLDAAEARAVAAGVIRPRELRT